MSLGSRPPGLHAGGSLPEGPSSPAPGQCPRSLLDPGRPTGLQGGSPQPGSQQNDRGDRGSSWGAELVPRWPARLPQRQARWSRCGRRDSEPLCCGPGRQGSSIKLKVPHLNSNRKGRSWGLPGAGLPAPRDAGPCQAGPCQARLCQAGSARRGSWQGGLSQGAHPALWVAFPGPAWVVSPATGAAANCPGRRLSAPPQVPAGVTLCAKGMPSDFSPEIPNAGRAALLPDPVTDWKWGQRQVGACSLPKQLARRCALGEAAAAHTGLGVSARKLVPQHSE